MPLPEKAPDYLRRLPEGWYTGYAWVHWSMTIEGRRSGWLDPLSHGALRELLLHVSARYAVICPAYCLMPDHAHFLWLGTGPATDQKVAAAFFRRHWNCQLRARGFSLQKQAYEHVLNEHERDPTVFDDTRVYILRNPERAALVEDWKEWPYSGALAAGYPDLDPRGEGALERFWLAHAAEVKKHHQG